MERPPNRTDVTQCELASINTPCRTEPAITTNAIPYDLFFFPRRTRPVGRCIDDRLLHPRGGHCRRTDLPPVRRVHLRSSHPPEARDSLCRRRAGDRVVRPAAVRQI